MLKKMNSKLECYNLEHELLELIGKASIALIYNDLRHKSNVCAFCSYLPNPYQKLKLFVLEINKTTPSESKVTLLCDACFHLKHIDKAIQEDLIALVNSSYSQEELIRLQRKGTKNINQGYKDKTIAVLKITPQKFLEDIQKDPLLNSPHIKAVFYKKFDWSHCR